MLSNLFFQYFFENNNNKNIINFNSLLYIYKKRGSECSIRNAIENNTSRYGRLVGWYIRWMDGWMDDPFSFCCLCLEVVENLECSYFLYKIPRLNDLRNQSSESINNWIEFLYKQNQFSAGGIDRGDQIKMLICIDGGLRHFNDKLNV